VVTVKVKSRSSMSMAEFARKALNHKCVCCDGLFPQEELKPARVVLVVKNTNILGKPIEGAPEQRIERAGMVCDKEKAGKLDASKNRIISIARKNIKIRMEESSRNGQPFYVEDK
jgi:hypothetical protein